MTRLTPRRYNLHVAIAVTLYVVLMALVWPLVRSMQDLSLKIVLAVLTVLPMLYVIGLMARRVRDSDELEQRTHLLALGVATAVVGGLSLVVGFLAAGQVLALDGAILIWVFPVLILAYGVTRWWLVTRRYGGSLGAECAPGHGTALAPAVDRRPDGLRRAGGMVAWRPRRRLLAWHALWHGCGRRRDAGIRRHRGVAAPARNGGMSVPSRSARRPGVQCA